MLQKRFSYSYQTTQGSNNGSAQNDVQPAASHGYHNAQQNLGNYYFHIYILHSCNYKAGIFLLRFAQKFTLMAKRGVLLEFRLNSILIKSGLVFTRILYYQYTDSMMGFLIVVGKMAMKRQLLKTINYFNPK